MQRPARTTQVSRSCPPKMWGWAARVFSLRMSLIIVNVFVPEHMRPCGVRPGKLVEDERKNFVNYSENEVAAGTKIDLGISEHGRITDNRMTVQRDFATKTLARGSLCISEKLIAPDFVLQSTTCPCLPTSWSCGWPWRAAASLPLSSGSSTMRRRWGAAVRTHNDDGCRLLQLVRIRLILVAASEEASQTSPWMAFLSACLSHRIAVSFARSAKRQCHFNFASSITQSP